MSQYQAQVCETFPSFPHRSFSNPRSSISSTTEDQAILLADTPPLAVIATAEVAGFPLSADAYLPKGSPPTFLFSTRVPAPVKSVLVKSALEISERLCLRERDVPESEKQSINLETQKKSINKDRSDIDE
ncbi:glutamate--tRNA ligase [Sarracenia purpurea var. burkii]